MKNIDTLRSGVQDEMTRHDSFIHRVIDIMDQSLGVTPHRDITDDELRAALKGAPIAVLGVRKPDVPPPITAAEPDDESRTAYVVTHVPLWGKHDKKGEPLAPPYYTSESFAVFMACAREYGWDVMIQGNSIFPVMGVSTKNEAIQRVIDLSKAGIPAPYNRFYAWEATMNPDGSFAPFEGRWEYFLEPENPETASPVLRKFLFLMNGRTPAVYYDVYYMVTAPSDKEALDKLAELRPDQSFKFCKYNEVE